MDYILTDEVTSPLNLADQYSENLAYMPNTFFIGDHMQMFPHLKEKLLVEVDGKVSDNNIMLNGVNLEALKQSGQLKASLNVSRHKITQINTEVLLRQVLY